MMQRFGVIAIWVGLVAALAGLVVGFFQLFNADDSTAGSWLGLIPVGFALMVLGIAITQLNKK